MSSNATMADPLMMAPDPTARAHERAAIGCCLHAGLEDARMVVLERVADTDFMDRNCRVSLKLIRQLVADGEETNISTLRLAAERHCITLSEQFLTDLAIDLPDPWAVERYVRAIKDAVQCRGLLDGARRVAMRAAAGDVEALADAREMVRAADEQAEVRDTAAFSAHVDEFTATLDRPVGAALGIATGLPRLDALTLGLRPGQFIVIAGRPGMGKSILGLGFAREAAFRGRRSVAYVSLEMAAREQVCRVVSAETGIAHESIRGNYLNATQRHEVERCATAIRGWDLFIDDTGRLSVDEMERRLFSLHRLYGLDLVVIDYLQLVDVDGGRSREQEVAKLSRTCKAIARTLNIPVVALSQLSRECEKRPDKRPMLHDLRESGSLEQDCDLALLLYRESYYNTSADEQGAELIVAKQRDGATGIMHCSFDGARMRFTP
jgi:replicative DNA helicase